MTIEAVLSALRTYTKAAIDWFINKYMKANPSKFQFMFLKYFRCKVDVPDSIDIENITITHQGDIKLLGITIDDKLRFNKHVNILCKSAARQLNVMYRFKNIFDIKEKENIYNTFSLANFNYCPTIWHLCGKAKNRMYSRTFFKVHNSMTIVVHILHY